MLLIYREHRETRRRIVFGRIELSLTLVALVLSLATPSARSEDPALVNLEFDANRIHDAATFVFVNATAPAADLARLDPSGKSCAHSIGFGRAGAHEFVVSVQLAGENQPAQLDGLSALGRQAVARLNQLGMIIDVSQLSPRALLQATKLSQAPVVASHSSTEETGEGARSLSDLELEAIKKTGGIVHVIGFRAHSRVAREDQNPRARQLAAAGGQRALASNFHGGDDPERELYEATPRAATVEGLLDTVDDVVRQIGVEHVGICADFNRGGGVLGWQNESEALNVTQSLLRRGYTEDQIAKLWGGNFARVVRNVRAASGRVRSGRADARETRGSKRDGQALSAVGKITVDTSPASRQ